MSPVVLAMIASLAPEWNPPPEYDHPYEGELIVRYAPLDEVHEMCDAMLPAMQHRNFTLGCARRSQDNTSCLVVVLNKPIARITPEAVLRHEIGHCNGWGADHGGPQT